MAGSIGGVIIGLTSLTVWCCARKKRQEFENQKPLADSIQLARPSKKNQLAEIGEEELEDYSDDNIGGVVLDMNSSQGRYSKTGLYSDGNI